MKRTNFSSSVRVIDRSPSEPSRSESNRHYVKYVNAVCALPAMTRHAWSCIAMPLRPRATSPPVRSPRVWHRWRRRCSRTQDDENVPRATCRRRLGVWKVAHLMRCEVRHEPPRDPGPAWLQVAGMLLSHVESAILHAVQNLSEAGPELAAVRAATLAGVLSASVRPGAGTSSGVSSSGMPSPGPLSRVSSGTRVRASSAATIVRGAVAASSRRWHRRRPAGLESLLSHSSAAWLVGRLFPEQIREHCTPRLARRIARSTLSGSSRPETARPRSDPPMDRRGDQKIITLARLQVLPRAHQGIPSTKCPGNYRSRGQWPANVPARLINPDSLWHVSFLRFPHLIIIFI